MPPPAQTIPGFLRSNAIFRRVCRAAAVPQASGASQCKGVQVFRRSPVTPGVHIKAVADLLGHSSIAITGDVYGHTSDDTARAAVEGLSGALGI